MYYVLLFLFLKPTYSVIYRVNETEYARMPALYSMDDYDSCMRDTQGLYCVADYDLFSTDRSPLMKFIQQYSAYTKKHFNHTQIHRALCVSSTCQSYLPHKNNKTADLNATLEACVNETIWSQYGVQAKLAKILYCHRSNDKKVISNGAFAVAGVYAIIFVLNMIGTFYDTILSKRDNKSGTTPKNIKKGNKYVLAFSLKRSWRKMVAPSGKGPDPRLERLKVIHGLRAMTMVCVIFSHTALTLAITYVHNPLYFEEAYNDPTKHVLFNGTLVTFTFFVMSAFLLVYNFLIHTEKHEISWFDFPKGVFLRWIRLTPPYTLIIATIGHLVPIIGGGPLWKLNVDGEAEACTTKWWRHILYINNYMFDTNNCMPQTWYLAADTQLFCFLLLVLVLVRTNRARKIAIIVLLILSLVITAATTYFNNLEAIIMQTPEIFRTLYGYDDTFKQIYILGHTNLSPCVLGFAAAMITYHWQNNKVDVTKYNSYRWAFWLLFPAGLAVILSGSVFYIDGFEPSILVKTLYATFYKVIFQAMVSIFIVGCIFKYENLYRGIVEWRGFTWMGRVSYSAFLVHTIFQRAFLGIQMSPIYVADYLVSVLLHSCIFVSYLAGAALFLFVEAPAAAFVKAVLTPSSGNKTEQNDK